MATLYELKGRQREIELELQHTDDVELRAALIDELDCLNESIDDKLNAYCIVYRNIEGEKLALEKEIERLEHLYQRLSASTTSITSRLSKLLGEGNKWKNTLHSISWRKSSAVRVNDEKLIPASYMREVLYYEPDRKQILQDLKAGATIPGAEIEERQNLTIK